EEADQILLLVNPADVRHVVNREASRANLVLYTRLSTSGEVTRFVEDVERFAASALPRGLRAHVTGTVVLLNRTADTLARQQVAGLAQMLLLLVVVLSAFFGSIRIGLLSLVPNVFPILVLFGLMGWTGIALDVSTSMIAAIAIGIAVDDTIHYLSEFTSLARRTGDAARATCEAIRTVGRPIVFTSVALAAGFLVSCFSGFQPVRHFGALSAATMVIAVLSDLVLTPAIAVAIRFPVARDANRAEAAGAASFAHPTEAELRRTGGSYG
ncbi:MAG: efflux RND transporter permease subunit, partial [Candidatus Binatia bacterium]